MIKNIALLILGSFLFLFFTKSLYSQSPDSATQQKIITSIWKFNPKDNFRQLIDSSNKYLQWDFSVPYYKGSLYAFKAIGLAGYLDSLKRNTRLQYLHIKEAAPILNEIDSLLLLAISTCDSCHLSYLSTKFEIDYDYHREVKSELDTLLKYGFKQPIEGFWVSPEYILGNNHWIGFELSYGIHYSLNLLKKNRKSKQREFSNKFMCFSVGNIGFAKSISSGGWRMNFSPMSVSAKYINLRPFNLTYLNEGSHGSLGYQPELGVHIWHVFINAGYNIAFRKSLKDYEKILIHCKVEIPFAKTKRTNYN